MTVKLKGELSTTLTPREREVLHLRAMGFDTRETAKRLGIKPMTVKNHQSEIERKMDSGNMIKAILRYILRGGQA